MMNSNSDPYLPEPLRDLKEQKVWVCMEVTITKDGQTKKLPISPITGDKASCNKPSDWGTFQEAKKMLSANDRHAKYRPQHLAIALTEELGITCIDLDGVLDPLTKEAPSWVLDLIAKVNSYTELSQSGKGLHIYAKGLKPSGFGCRGLLDPIEVYDRDRFMIVTNQPFKEVLPLREASEEIASVCAQYLKKSDLQKDKTSDGKERSPPMSDQEILKRVSTVTNGDKFKCLYERGDISDYGGDYSRADLALMSILAFWTQDCEQLERLFSASALGCRSKWNERSDYRERTINKSLELLIEHYTPNPSKKDDASLEKTTAQLPSIRVEAGERPFVVDQAEKLLIANNSGIYQRAGMLVCLKYLESTQATSVIKRKEAGYVISDVNHMYLAEELMRYAQWDKYDHKQKGYKRIDCPCDIAKTLLARKKWSFPYLRGIIHSPTLRSDGSVINKVGFDHATGLFLVDTGIIFESIPDFPTKEDAYQALQVLKMIIKDFPFVDEVGQSVSLSSILTALIRKLIATAPMHAFTAPKMSSGKSLLADIVSLIESGKPNSVLSHAEDEAEERKRLLSVLLEGDAVICYDNIEGEFSSSALCSVLTQRFYKGRLLGSNMTVEAPTDISFLATGNNLIIEGDLSTRTLLCALDPGVEHPEEREFEIDLYTYIPEFRAKLIAAGLTVIKAYQAAGFPKQDIKNFGRFEDWSKWVRSPLIWLGMADPCISIKEIAKADPIRISLGILLDAWYAVFGDLSQLVKTVVKAVRDSKEEKYQQLKDALIDLGGDLKGEINEKSIGKKFSKYKNRIERSYRLENTGTHQGSMLWRVVKVDTP